MNLIIEASRGAGAQVCDCKLDWLWVRSPLEEIKYLFKFIFSLILSGVEAKRKYTKPSVFGGKWQTQCLNTTFPLPTLLYAEFSVKLI